MNERFKYAPATVDWRSVDWSMTDAEIAKKLELDEALVRAGRLLYGPALAPCEITAPRTTRG